MEILGQTLPVIIYILLIILIIVLIVFMIKAFDTLKKLDSTIADVNSKMKKLNGVFNIVDRSADAINMATDKVIEIITSSIGKLFKRKTKTKKEEEKDYE